eukprot:m51a1_g7144 hypothetical protein (564) ;mRNA; r:314068-316783
MAAPPANPPVKLDCSACPTEFVCVYNDRAEVTRRVAFSVGPGATDVVVQGVTGLVDRASVRVSGATGDVAILEVSSEPVVVPAASQTAEQARLRLAELAAERARLAGQRDRLGFEREWLRKARCVAAPGGRTAVPPKAEEASAQLAWFGEQSERVASGLLDVDRRIEEVDATAQALQQQQSGAGREAGSGRLRPAVDVTVSVGAGAAGAKDCAVHVTYLVAGASWAPTYGIRYASRDPDRLELTYYGTNSTGEAWRSASVSLSTATPALGGVPPKLYTARARLLQRPQAHSGRSPAQSSLNTLSANPLYLSNTLSAGECEDLASGPGCPGAAAVLTASVESGATSATFAIPRAASIEADGRPHRVTVAVLSLAASTSYTAVPALRAAAKNTSEYPVLAGSASVFIDGNFVTTTELRECNPGEQLDVFLGVDPGVSVAFAPHRESVTSGGVIRRTSTKLVTHATTLRNCKQTQALVHVFDQLPLSADDKVRVKLLEPADAVPVSSGASREGDASSSSSSGGSGGVELNEYNNLRWTVALQPGAQHVVTLRYTVEWPAGADLVIN